MGHHRSRLQPLQGPALAAPAALGRGCRCNRPCAQPGPQPASGAAKRPPGWRQLPWPAPVANPMSVNALGHEMLAVAVSERTHTAYKGADGFVGGPRSAEISAAAAKAEGGDVMHLAPIPRRCRRQHAADHGERSEQGVTSVHAAPTRRRKPRQILGPQTHGPIKSDCGPVYASISATAARLTCRAKGDEWLFGPCQPHPPNQ